MKTITYILLLFISTNAICQTIPYTLEAEKRAIRMEESLKTLNNKLIEIEKKNDVRFDIIDKRFESIQSQINFMSNIMVALLVSLIGAVAYMNWDRHKSNIPIEKSLEDKDKQYQRLKQILNEFAEKNADLKEIMNRAALY
jgi:H+/gluconate symporter-like permease